MDYKQQNYSLIVLKIIVLVAIETLFPILIFLFS